MKSEVKNDTKMCQSLRLSSVLLCTAAFQWILTMLPDHPLKVCLAVGLAPLFNKYIVGKDPEAEILVSLPTTASLYLNECSQKCSCNVKRERSCDYRHAPVFKSYAASSDNVFLYTATFYLGG